MRFSDGFIWGAAVAAYQVEGGASADGRAPSVWDTFCRKPGAVTGGATGDTACDFYHRWNDDIALMKQLGLQAFRYSISWPRVMPSGVDRENPAGMDFYDRLTDTLCEADIEPWVTLFHWDLPQVIQDRGGWNNPDISDWFADYAARMVYRLGDRVRHWITVNEPVCFIGAELHTGGFAPGLRLPWADVLQAGHHMLLAHGKAIQAIRGHAPRPQYCGWTLCGRNVIPASDRPEDIDAARTVAFRIQGEDLEAYSWWADPAVLGHYPEDGLRQHANAMPAVTDEDMAIIQTPMDFFGMNLYTASLVRQGADGQPEVVPWPDGMPLTHMDWPITPDALYWMPKLLHERYGLPIVVLENGMANIDFVCDGQVADPQRIAYTRDYLRALHRAIADGTPVQGYFHWSLMDNFEWALAYTRRFGLIHVDYQTQTRTIKQSGHWYARVIQSHGETLWGEGR